MDVQFKAESIGSTDLAKDGSLVVRLVDAAGKSSTLSLTPSLARALTSALSDFVAAGGPAAGPTATKLPTEFAVGTGRHERVVLVRFEDDPPYGLDPVLAAELGHALVEQAESVADAGVSLHH